MQQLVTDKVIIKGRLEFEDVKLLVEKLPEEDKHKLKNYLLLQPDDTWAREFDSLLSKFRNHDRSNEEIEQDVANALEEARHAKN